MSLGDVLLGLVRRWYIVVPGLILAIAVGVGAWFLIKPDYQRTASQLLLPGTASIPPDQNPYLYLDGLSQAADVLVTSMSSERELNSLVKGYPGATVVITRDPVTPGPQILTTVTARSDAAAGAILDAAVARTTERLGSLQKVNGVTAGNRIGIMSITRDNQSTLVQKTRLLAVAGSATGMLVLTLLIAGLVEGLSSRRRRITSSTSTATPADDGSGLDDRLSEGEAAALADAGIRPAGERRPALPRPATRGRELLREQE